MNKKLLFGLILVFPLILTSQNTLEKAKSSLKSSNSNSGETTVESSSNTSDDYNPLFPELNEFMGRIFLELTFGVVYAVFVEFPSDGKNKHAHATLTKHPYFENKKGDFNWDNDTNFKPNRFFLTNQYIKNKARIQGNYLKGELQFANRFGMTGDFLYLSENDYLYDKSKYKHFSLLVNYYRVRSEKFSLWYGLGARYVANGVHAAGIAYSLGTRLYVAKPISIEASFIGSIINKSSVDHLNTEIKYHTKNYTLSTGYSNFTIGSENFNAINIGFGIYF